MPVRSRPTRNLGFLGYAAAMFCLVSGGPFGFETVVNEVGFSGTYLLLVLVPLLWALPIGLMTAEMGTALPVEGGYVVWTRRALGERAGFLCGWWTWLYSIVDAAIYPAMFATYAIEGLKRIGVAGAEAWRWPMAFALVVVLTGLNLGGVRGVGRAAVGLTIAILLPFVPLAVASMGHRMAPAPSAISTPSLSVGLATILWNFLGWDNLSTIDGEVRDPSRTIPRGVLVALGMIVLTYLLPTLALHRVFPDPETWGEGAWARFAGTLGGDPLFAIVTIGALASAAAMFATQMLGASRIPSTLAEFGFFPRAFAAREGESAPRASVILCAALYAGTSYFSFKELITVNAILYAAGILLEFAALLVLRHREPNLPRPFRIPGGWPIAILAALGPLALGILLVVSSVREDGWGKQIPTGLALVSGPIIYAAVTSVRLNPATS